MTRQIPHQGALGSAGALALGTIAVGTLAAGTIAVGASAWLVAHTRSARVAGWTAGSGTEVRVGRIGARVHGTGDHVILFLSGIAASGAFWGADYDRLAARNTLVFADPLGFGRSVVHDDPRLTYDVDDHVDSLRMLLEGLSLDGRPLTIIGHSMGGSLAILLAAALATPPRRVVTIGAPLYRDRTEADERVAGMGWFEALLAQGPLAERVCRWMCAHHDAARLIAVLGSPTLPIPIARDGVIHTWASYSGSFESLIASRTWEDALGTLVDAAVPVDVIVGAHDPVPVPGRADQLAARSATVAALSLPGGHDAPLSHPVETLALLQRLLSESAPVPSS